jgi:hypothetical protein
MTIEEILAKIAELKSAGVDTLTADQCAELKSLIVEADKAIPDDIDIEDVPVVNELSELIKAVNTRLDAIATQVKEAADARAAAKQAIADAVDPKASDEPVVDPDADADAPKDPDADTDADAEQVDADAKTPALAASVTTRPRFGNSPSNMARGGKTVNISPELDSGAGRIALLAAANLDGIPSGTPFADKESLARGFETVIRRIASNGDVGRWLVASADYSGMFPEERRVRDGDTNNNDRKMGEIANLVASGGIPQPYNVAYDLETVASDATPFADGCGSVLQCNRGGLSFRLPLSVGSLSSSTGTWSAATDANPGGSTKAIYTAPVLTSTSATVNAITTRIQFGNLMGQFDPESIAMYMDLSASATARQREITLLTTLQAAAGVNTITSAKILGESRDWLATVFQTAARFRYVNRIPKTQRLVVVLPEYVKTIMNIDRLYEQAHSSPVDTFQMPDSYWDDCLASENIRAIWTEDALGANAGAGTFVTQQLADFTTGALQAFPTAIMWNMYCDGMVQRLDAGLLNLGVVRDSILDGTNDYEIFREVFETVAYRGPTNMLLQIVSTTHATGASSLPIAVS